jgi:sensor histidine kinase YesM
MSFLFPQDQIWIKAPLILTTALIWGIFHNALIAYSVVYYLVPKYFVKKKYVLFAVNILLLFIIVFGLNVLYNIAAGSFTSAIGKTAQHPFMFLRGTLIRLFGNAPLICGLLLSLKTLKTWHLKQLENETLIKETASAELQLLKAQIHPHFLFNTLNNIYSFTLTKSPQASELVQKLSDMLSYMVSDCEQVMVPLEKEIQLIKDYIGLEKVRYDDRLDIQMHIKGDCKNKMIVPLLMIPFVENCFKHGASMMRGRQWMQLIININDNDLDFTLSNSKPRQTIDSSNKKGIGLANVQKRLELLYPGKHFLKTESTGNTYMVRLQVSLQQIHALDSVHKPTPKLQSV